MALDVKIILPNNLRSGYLQSEFISSGLAYTTNLFSKDPSVNQNSNQIVLGFELKDVSTRENVNLARINTLYLSNDPYFEQSSTVKINNWPGLGTTYNQNYNYIYNLNSNYFFDSSLSQGSFASTESGTGLFKINNWPLSANGGLSRVYIKAVIEGPGSELVEYPNGYGIFDSIYWEGNIPSSPSSLKLSSYKDGWIGKNTQGNFISGSNVSDDINDGINSYLLSLLEVESIGNTYEIYSASSSSLRSLFPDITSKNLNYNSYRFYNDGSSFNYSLTGYIVGSPIGLGSQTFDRGAFFYSTDTLNYNSYNDMSAQASFAFTAGSIGSTSSLYLKLSENTDESNSGDEYVLQVDIPGLSFPTAKLFTVVNGVKSLNSQITNLPFSLTEKLKTGGLLELYTHNIGTQFNYIEGYFTPSDVQNDNKSYLLANAVVPTLSPNKVGFGYQIETNGTEQNSILVNDIVMSAGKNILSADIGNLNLEDLNLISPPISKIINTWTTDDNIEYFTIQDSTLDYNVSTSKNSTYFEVQKIDPNNSHSLPIVYEIQLNKASFSNKCSLEVKVEHNSDDFYIAFSKVSSYRPHSQNGIQVEWDRPLATRCLDAYAYSNTPNNAPTIVVKFDANKQIITVLQRDDNNKFYKHNIKSYVPTDSFDRFLIEITDQVPSNLKGLKNSKLQNATWIYIKTITGQKIDLLGYAQLSTKVPSSDMNVGYYAACGFIKSQYDVSNNTDHNKVYEMIFRSKINIDLSDKKEYKNVKTFTLSPEGFSNNKHYMGLGLLSSSTFFKDFGYKNPVSSTSVIEVSAASIGENIDIDNLASATIDGVSMSSIDIDSYIIIKDQENDSQNGLYKKTYQSVFEKQTASSNTPYKIVNGNVNQNNTFYLVSTIIGSVVSERFISTNFFTKINIKQLSSLVSGYFRPELLEIKLNFSDYESELNLNNLKVRFYSDSNGVPDYDNALTNWLSINFNPLTDSFTFSPLSNLVQIKMENFANLSPLVTSGDDIWLEISLPFNTSLGRSNGIEESNNLIIDGKFTNYKLANNLWHKLYFKYYEKFTNQHHGFLQQARVRSLSNGLINSHATTLSDSSKIDIIGPSSNGDLPVIENLANTSTRSVNLSISAEDDSGIMAFRVGRDIDNFRIQYTPWMNWEQFSKNDDGTYSIYLYGNLNYYNDGSSFTNFESQNIGYSGARKIWIQMMDFCGNVSESLPLTFVAQAWYLVDTMPPIGSVKFWDTKTNQATELTNLNKPIIKINADDIVSGVKDFKYRKILDSGPDEWSDWEMLIPYKLLDLSNESDGVKKVEFVFRDYGNNSTQPESKWEKVKRP